MEFLECRAKVWQRIDEVMICIKCLRLHYNTLHYLTTPLTPEVTSGASKMSYLSFVSEQVSFELVFKSIDVC